jgi:hypothetical protein
MVTRDYGRLLNKAAHAECEGKTPVAKALQAGDPPINAPATSPIIIFTISLKSKIGAGEAIRTLDPNLGKVVLYP